MLGRIVTKKEELSSVIDCDLTYSSLLEARPIMAFDSPGSFEPCLTRPDSI